MLYSTRRNVRNWTLGKPNNVSTEERHNTDVPPLQDSAVHLHLKENGHSFQDSPVRVLAHGDRWSERGVKEPSIPLLLPPTNQTFTPFQETWTNLDLDSPPCDPADKGETPQQKPVSSELKKPSG
ncbi:hypothetical protein D4764_13G0007450 [Takifugu flavidus]|uniref:Uncharacterized protein n=1 Tax=Takifugu flavidus TaxID=433684 RepID=A0A5C6P9B9_9TELE|nr:hypothetical protein D4764_13G0007450 [Takifugu flavidus]